MDPAPLEHWIRGPDVYHHGVFLFAEIDGGWRRQAFGVAFLWTGPIYALPFAVVLSVLACIYKFGWANAQRVNGSARIPLAPSTAGAGPATSNLGTRNACHEMAARSTGFVRYSFSNSVKCKPPFRR